MTPVRNNKYRDSCVLGVDGGGTKTRAVVVDAEGRVLADCTGGATAIVGLPGPKPMANLCELVCGVLADSGIPVSRLVHMGIGLSGVDFADEFHDQQSALSVALQVSPSELTLVNDAIAALWGASDVEAAGIIQHGTDFTAAWRTRKGDERLFDHLNVGGFRDPRRETLRVTARMIDGRLPETPLLGSVLKWLEIGSPSSFAEAVYRKRLPSEKYARLHRELYQAWEEGDTTADGVMQDVLNDYVVTIQAIRAQVGHEDAFICLGGGLLESAPPTFHAMLKRRLPDVTMGKAALHPAAGAALMAFHQAGYDTTDIFQALKKQIQ